MQRWVTSLFSCIPDANTMASTIFAPWGAIIHFLLSILCCCVYVYKMAGRVRTPGTAGTPRNLAPVPVTPPAQLLAGQMLIERTISLWVISMLQLRSCYCVVNVAISPCWHSVLNSFQSLMLSSVRTDGRIRRETAIFRPYGWKTAYLGAIFCPQSLVCGISGRVDSMCYLHLCIFTSYVLFLDLFWCVFLLWLVLTVSLQSVIVCFLLCEK